MSTVRIRNVSPNGDRFVPSLRVVVKAGDEIDVPAEAANGSPPYTATNSYGDEYEHPGWSGLLAQEDHWQAVATKKASK